MVSEHLRARTPVLIVVLVAGAVSASAGQARGSLAPVEPGRRTTEQRAQAAAPVPPAPLKQVVVNGARYFTDRNITAFLKLRIDAPLPAPPSALAEDLRRRYVDQGYSFAHVAARFDENAGRLTFDVDEGRIDAIEFEGVSTRLATDFIQDFVLQPGDVFRRTEATRAVRLLLQPMQGAIRPAESSGAGAVLTGIRRLRRSLAMPFEMIDRDGKRVLVVHLATRRSDFNLSLGTEGREDWFDPVDGFAPAIGFNETVFDPAGFNHTYIAGYLSYKFGRDHAGYSIGFERPFLTDQHLFIGAELHDQTASDDEWRLSPMEQSLAAAGFKASARDYYQQCGYQLNASVQFGAGHEVLAAWRDERQETLANTSDFSVFRRDQTYRPNQPAEPGRLHVLVFGYTWESRGLRDQSRAGRYERHQMADSFGSWGGEGPGWRIEWTSEIAAPGALGGDFDYRRHVLNVRRYNRFSPRHTLNLRAIAGIGEGTLPPQQLLAIGGIGSVPGYGFKEAIGDRMVLLNVEYKYRLDRGIHPLILYDAGRVFRPASLSRDDWMQALGTGLELGDGFRIAAFWPFGRGRPAEILVRLRPTF
jgi:outer membrane protein assembly factor BamA